MMLRIEAKQFDLGFIRLVDVVDFLISPLVAQFGRMDSSGNSADKYGGDHCAQQKSYSSLPQICASTQSCKHYKEVPSTSWLDFISDVHCQL